MIAWKTVHQEEHADVKAHLFHTSDGINGTDFLAVPISGLIGCHIRVTVEEEVSECCEQWRGASIWRNSVSTCGSTSSCSSVGPTYPVFCPECGRKL